jgi:hypothetical protein
MPDDDYFWWGKLKGETYRLMVQNAEHSMATGARGRRRAAGARR